VKGWIQNDKRFRAETQNDKRFRAETQNDKRFRAETQRGPQRAQRKAARGFHDSSLRSLRSSLRLCVKSGPLIILLLYRLGTYRCMVSSREAVSLFVTGPERLSSEDLLGGSSWCHRALQNQPLMGASKPATTLGGFSSTIRL
jgi:hypothetical protein